MKTLIYSTFPLFVSLLVGCADNSTRLETAGKHPTEQPAQKIYIDPATGQISTPPANHFNTVQRTQTPTTPTQPIVETTHADGSVSVNVKGRFQSWLVANKNCNGQVTLEHATHSTRGLQTDDCSTTKQQELNKP